LNEASVFCLRIVPWNLSGNSENSRTP